MLDAAPSANFGDILPPMDLPHLGALTALTRLELRGYALRDREADDGEPSGDADAPHRRG